jgi:rubrerythrin
MSENMNVLEREALAAAIEMEQKGYDFFNDTAEKADDPMAKEVFKFLALEELNHIKAIEIFNQQFLSGGEVKADEVIEQMIADRPIVAINELFKNLSKSAPVEGGNLDAYKFAMDFERKGGEFYQKVEAEATDPNAKKLFAFLVGEEQKHFKIVESCLLYVENPEEFFHQQEKWHLEG